MAANAIDDSMMEQAMSAVLPPLLSLNLIHHARECFVQDPLTEQAATFARAVLDDHARDDRPHDLRLRSLHTFMIRKQTMRSHVDSADMADMERSGLIGTILDEANRGVFTGRIPELIASELSRQIAAELPDRMGDDEQDRDAADWLVGITARLPLGDVIGAASLFDLLGLQRETPGLSIAFMNQLLSRSPSIRPLRPGTRSIAWVPSVGRLDTLVRADAVTVVKRPGFAGSIELDPDEGSVVDRLEPGDKLLNRVSNVLGETGVVSGEFGFVEVHAHRKELIERYQDDPRPKVQAYARERARDLAQHMGWEQRRAARDVAARRREWGEE